MLDHTESRCEKLFNAVDGIVEKGWRPELKAPDRFGRVLDGDRWLKQNLDTADMGLVVILESEKTSDKFEEEVNAIS